MAVKVPNEGENALLNALKGTYFSLLSLRLFANNHTPSDSDTNASYTEATFPGYSAIPLNSWGTVGTNADGKAEVSEVSRTFTCTGTSPANTIYGYYITSGTTVVFAERNPSGPVTLNNFGQTYTVQPKITLRSES